MESINESSSWIDDENGMIYCVVCNSPKDDDRDDCGCMYKYPLKHNEKEAN